jgi:hypothetical protein
MPAELPAEKLPDLIYSTYEDLRTNGFTVHCPMGEAVKGRAVICRKARDLLGIRSDPLAIKLWCSSEHGYHDPQTGCPIWLGEKEGDGKIERTLAAREEAKVRLETARQIEAGIRVDDRGLDPDSENTFQDSENVVHVVDDEELSDGLA